MMRGALSSVGLVATLACASTGSGEKGVSLVPFGQSGITTAAGAPRRVALLIGIDRFEDERFPELRYAAADARAMGGALRDFDQVQVLTAPELTTRAAILAALADLERAVRDPRDTVVLYLSTHGSLGRTPGGQLQRFLVARDTRMNVLAQTGLGVDELLRGVDALRSRRKVVVLATCHSGKGKSHVDDALAAALAEHKAPPLAPLTEVSEATIVLTACAFGETARESPELGHDIYTYYFLEALAAGAADRDGDGAVTASEAHDYARDRTYAFTGGVQRPTAESDVLGRDPIVLAGALLRVAQPVLYSYAPSAEGLALLIDGTEKGALPGGVAVAAGAHEIELRDQGSGATLYRGSVDLAAGQRSDVTRLIPRPRDLLVVAQLGGLTPLLAPASGYLPLALSIGAAAQVRDWPWPHLVGTLRTSYLVGAGTAPGYDEVLPYWLHAIDLGLDVGYAFALHDRVSLTPALAVGTLMAGRFFDSATYHGRELVRGTRAGVALRVEWQVLDDVWLMPQLEAGALALRLGDGLGPYPYFSIGVAAGYSL